MAGERIRSVKPEWLDDEKLASTSDTARMISVALIVLSDDYGRGRANRLFLASRVYPYSSRDPRETLATLSGGLSELCGCGFLRLYQVSGQDYFEIVNWSRHQRVDKPGKPRVPEPLATSSRESREGLAPDLGSGIMEEEEEGEERSAPGLPASDSAETRPEVDPMRKVDCEDVYRAWHDALKRAGHTHSFAKSHHPLDLAAIAESCNAKRRPQLALDTVCAWYWTAPDGPIVSGRVKRHGKSLALCAKNIASDLDNAYDWLKSTGGLL